MASALLKKSVTDLTRRKARTVFAVLTLAIAVASVGIFATPSLMDQAMQKEVQANKLPDLDPEHEAARASRRRSSLRSAGCRTSARRTALSYFQTRVWVGERRVKALVVGVPDYGSTSRSTSSRSPPGTHPTGRRVLTDFQNAKQGRYSGQGRRHDPDRRRRRPDADRAGQRRRPQPDRRPAGRRRRGSSSSTRRRR